MLLPSGQVRRVLFFKGDVGPSKSSKFHECFNLEQAKDSFSSSYANLEYQIQETPLEDRIIGGSEVPISQAPYQVGIFRRNSGIHCGGTIYDKNTGKTSEYFRNALMISAKWLIFILVITAAHCFLSGSKPNTIRAKKDLVFVFGKSDLRKVEKCSETLRMAEAIAIHPKYIPDPPEDQANDIAIVKLDKPLCIRKNTIEPLPIIKSQNTLPGK